MTSISDDLAAAALPPEATVDEPSPEESDPQAAAAVAEPKVSSSSDLSMAAEQYDSRARVSDATAAAAEEEEEEDSDGDGDDDWMQGFRVGDMVWGKVKSHPWWPGHIYHEALAAVAVRRTRREGSHVLVAFFGDSSYGWFDPAELIPFAPHFPEKSSQTSARSFAAAVAEAVDEASRRGALAVTCFCRNPTAFRPAALPGYVTVDVPGYERGAVYSDEQVDEARALFVAERAAWFVRGLAMAPREAGAAATKDVDFIKMMAMLAAYRRATYEEFDETYAQAFGVEPTRVAPGEEQIAQRAAPLTGKQKTPEQLGGRKGGGGAASRLMAKVVPGAAAVKVTSSKKNQFLLKRRDDAHVGALPSSGPVSAPAPAPDRPCLLPYDQPTIINSNTSANTIGLEQTPAGFSNDAAAAAAAAVALARGDIDEYVLQRRAPPAVAPAAYPVDGRQEPLSQMGQEREAVAGGAVAKKVKKGKIRKREREEAGVAGEVRKRKKKQLAEHGDTASAARPVGRPRKSDGQPSRTMPQVPLFNLDMGSLDVPQMVTDLEELALDPSHGTERDAPAVVRSFLLAFRSKVYQKSLANAPPGELDASDARSVRPVAELSLPAKPAKKKLILRPDDPTKGGRKRGLSDRQEEMTVKKKKKMDKIKTLAAEKKAGLNQKDGGPAASATPAMAASQVSAGQPSRPGSKPDLSAKKREPAPPVIKTPSPTALMMKFPPRSTLPSVASLKARFARFGQLDLDGIRVYWKSHMCKVIYRFKSEAQIALNYARNNDIFGQVKVHYYLREVESSAPEPASDSALQRADQRSTEIPSFRPGSTSSGGTLAQPRPLPLRPSVGQPKSILKKASDDSMPAVGSVSREVPRVKFMLDGADSRVEPPPAAAGTNGSSNGNGNNGADPAISRNLKPVTFLPTPLPPLPRPTQLPSQPSRALNTQYLPPPPQPVPPRIDGLLPMPSQRLSAGPDSRVLGLGQADAQTPQYSGRDGAQPGYAGVNAKPRVDISTQMLKLLVQCNDIVDLVKSNLGYVPYHPI